MPTVALPGLTDLSYIVPGVPLRSTPGYKPLPFQGNCEIGQASKKHPSFPQNNQKHRQVNAF
ncbi:MAG: hypothetical protein ACYDBB_24905 [Armatimonadota bacterium]